MKIWKMKAFRIFTYVMATFLIFLTASLVAVLVLVKPNDFKSVAAQSSVCSVDAGVLLNLINTERSRLGAPSLTIDSTLASTAHRKLTDMQTNTYFGHNLADNSPYHVFLDEAGIKAASSEDLGINADSSASDWALFKASPEHYASLSDPKYTRIGIATQCIPEYALTKETDSDANAPVGTKIHELTVIHLAAPEPVVQQAPAVQRVYVPYQAPSVNIPRSVANPVRTTCHYDAIGQYVCTTQ